MFLLLFKKSTPTHHLMQSFIFLVAIPLAIALLIAAIQFSMSINDGHLGFLRAEN